MSEIPFWAEEPLLAMLLLILVGSIVVPAISVLIVAFCVT